MVEYGRSPGVRVRLCALLLALLVAPPLPAQERGSAVIAGRVAGEDGGAVPGVVVTAEGPGGRRSALTDGQGRYRIAGLAAGEHLLGAEHLGFVAQSRRVTAAPGEVRREDFSLRVAAVEIQGIEVRAQEAQARERERFETDPGVTARVVGGREIKLLPGLAEADVMRAMEVLPGVVSTSDFSSAFNVRGGSADQNLILLDGIPIFNPFHLGGLFSVFNSDVIARAELLAGGFGAEYGGRVSSVLNVETRPGTEEGLHGDVGVSLLATRVSLQSRLPDALTRAVGATGGGWFVSGRRSYFDKILPTPVRFPYHLTDLQAGGSLFTPGEGRVSVTAYTGRDILDLSDFGDDESILRVQWEWGNDVVGARWEQPLGAWRADGRIGFSRYREELGLPDFGDTRFASRIAQVTTRLDLAREHTERLSTKLGMEANRIAYENLGRAGGTEFFSGDDAGVLGATYGALLWKPSEWWIVEPGVRLDVWWGTGTTRSEVSPRLAVKRFFGSEREGAVKLSVGRYAQFLHSLRDEEFPISNDTWILADARVPHVVSDQVQVGVERYWGDAWYASAEAYGRDFRGVVSLNAADDPNDPDDDFLEGEGRSYGLDLMVRRSAGRLTGWATVSLLRAERTFPDPLAAGWEELPDRVTYPPIFDRRVDVDLVAQYRLPWAMDLGGRWNYGSGLPYTRPTGQYVDWNQNVSTGRYRFVRFPGGEEGESPPLYVVLGERNAERYPAYHRLDVTLRRRFERGWGSYTPYLQVLNLYNQKNVLFYFYNFDDASPTRSGVSMFPVLPALGVEVSF